MRDLKDLKEFLKGDPNLEIAFLQQEEKLERMANDIEEILLSFHVLLNNLLKKNTVKAQLSILKGPLLNPTRRKLKKLNDDFGALDNHLSNPIPGKKYLFSKPLNNYWDGYNGKKRKAIVYKNNLLAKLTPNSEGTFFNDIKRYTLKQEEITKLKEDVDGFLAIIRVLKR